MSYLVLKRIVKKSVKRKQLTKYLYTGCQLSTMNKFDVPLLRLDFTYYKYVIFRLGKS